MSETLRERLDNLEMFLKNLYEQNDHSIMSKVELHEATSYHLTTMDCLNKTLERKE